ncbi:MAG: phage tail family protein, partial [Lactobacillus sp.]|nr:phage tail family protein [Lactobacillus sp.]
MYKFRDLELARSPTVETRPADALNYDGHWLDDEIAEFKTLTVSSRDDFSRSINTVELSSDGSQYLGSRFTDKKLEVKFFLDCDNATQYENAVSKIKQILYPSEKKIKFNDEQNYYYIGTVDSFVLDNPLYSTTGKISFTVSN